MKWAITLAAGSTSQSSIVSPVDKWIRESQQATIWSAKQTPIRMNIALTRNFTAFSMNFAISTVISFGKSFHGTSYYGRRHVASGSDKEEEKKLLNKKEKVNRSCRPVHSS
jgi:hypothetical protein